MAEPDKRSVTMEELLVSSLAQTDALAKLLVGYRFRDPPCLKCIERVQRKSCRISRFTLHSGDSKLYGLKLWISF
jgi:hypothetical protein